jgi:predicted type IV restriction endonuclease
MANIPQKIHDRLVAGVKKFQPVLAAAHGRGANESDTVIIITAILSEVFGYDPFNEITSEIAIRGTYCDLATKLEEKIQSLLEAKAINQELKENHVTQAVGYAITKGVDWVLLTNGVVWQIYKVIIAKPVDREKVVEIDFFKIDHHKPDDLESLFLFTKESWVKSALADYYDKNQALSPFTIAQVILTEEYMTMIRRKLRQISPNVKIEIDKIRDVIEQDVLKHDVVEGDKADEARKRVAKVANHAKRSKTEQEAIGDESVAPEIQNEETGANSPSSTPTAIPIQKQAI